jgi:hypothetical protein
MRLHLHHGLSISAAARETGCMVATVRKALRQDGHPPLPRTMGGRPKRDDPIR